VTLAQIGSPLLSRGFVSRCIRFFNLLPPTLPRYSTVFPFWGGDIPYSPPCGMFYSAPRLYSAGVVPPQQQLPPIRIKIPVLTNYNSSPEVPPSLISEEIFLEAQGLPIPFYLPRLFRRFEFPLFPFWTLGKHSTYLSLVLAPPPPSPRKVPLLLDLPPPPPQPGYLRTLCTCLAMVAFPDFSHPVGYSPRPSF